MSIFDNLKTLAQNAAKPSNESQTFTFSALPESLEQLKALPEAAMDTPFKTAALTVCALCAYAAAPEIGKEMVNFLKGPAPLSNSEILFLRDRFMDSKLVPFSYFEGAAPENDYTPATPYRLTVTANSYSYQNEQYATLYVKSGGADTPRPITLRLKPSEGKWYLDQQQILVGIRTAKSADPWA